MLATSSTWGYLCGDLAAKSEGPRGLRDAMVRSLDDLDVKSSEQRSKFSSRLEVVSNSPVFLHLCLEVHGMSIVDAGIGESSWCPGHLAN